MSLFIHPSPPPSPQPAPLPLSSSSLTRCPELELSTTHSPTPKTAHAQPKPRPQRQTQQPDQSQPKPRPQRQTQRPDQSQPKPRPQRQTAKKRNTKVRFEEPMVIASPPEAQQPMRAQRGSRERPHAFRPTPTSSHEPSRLEKPELHSTLALKAELLSVQGEEFDSKKAVQETLQKSERTKNLISARAAEVMNVSRSQHLFTSLVSVSVQEDQLISQVLHDRLLLAPPPRSAPVTTAAEAPSLLVFRNSDIFRDKPLPQEEEPAARQPRPSARPSSSTFDLYRRQRCWEATP